MKESKSLVKIKGIGSFGRIEEVREGRKRKYGWSIDDALCIGAMCIRSTEGSEDDDWEIFARYEEGDANGGIGNAFNIGAEDGNPSILTIGANYFINDNVKFTVDWGINFAENMSIFTASGSDTGWTSSDSSDQWVLRAQLQLLF